MKKYDVAGMKAVGYGQREKNVFHETREFKLRIIHLAPGESMPKCEMASHVIFVGIEGTAEVSAGPDKAPIAAGQVIVSEPGTLCMETDTGARILGIQIIKRASE